MCLRIWKITKCQTTLWSLIQFWTRMCQSSSGKVKDTKNRIPHLTVLWIISLALNTMTPSFIRVFFFRYGRRLEVPSNCSRSRILWWIIPKENAGCKIHICLGLVLCGAFPGAKQPLVKVLLLTTMIQSQRDESLNHSFIIQSDESLISNFVLLT